jgi:hypothetical protein
VVTAFYTALGDANGARAVKFINPEKQETGNYTASGMTRFYSSLLSPLTIDSVKDQGNNTVEASYHFQKPNGDFCYDTVEVNMIEIRTTIYSVHYSTKWVLILSLRYL